MSRSVTTLTLCLVALWALPCSGQDENYGYDVRRYDTLVLSGGRRIDGQILEDNGDFVELLNDKNIKQQFRRSEVKEIIRAVLPKEAYRKRMKREGFQSDSYDDQLAVGKWAAQYASEIGQLAIVNLEIATRIDPSQQETYELLLPLLADHPGEVRDDAALDAELGIYLRGLEAGIALPELATRAADHFEKQRDYESAIVVLKRLYSQSAEPPDGTGGRVAELLNRSGRRDEARAWVEDLLTKAPAAARDRLQAMHAGWLLEDVAVGNVEARATFLDVVSSLADDSGIKHLLRGSYFLILDDADTAAEPLRRAGQLGVFDAPAIVTYALLYAQTGDSKQARLTLENARKAVGVRVSLALVRAYLLENDGDDAGALQLLRTTMNEASDAPWQAWIVYLHALQRLAPDESIDAPVRTYLKRFVDNPVAFAEGALLLADQALRDGDGPKARRWFDYAGVGGHEGFEYYLGLAHAHMMEGGNPVRARAALDAARALSSDNLDVWNTLGYAEYTAGAFERASQEFERVIATFTEEERELPEPPAALAYALAGRYLVNAATGQELWADNFERADGQKPLNSWDESETYGIEIGLRQGSAIFEGTQEYEDDGRTALLREVQGERLARIRVTLSVSKGLQQGTVGLRIEDENGGSGLVFFRHPDGDLSFSMNGRDRSDVVRTPTADETTNGDEGGEQHPSVEYAMKRVLWDAADDDTHTLEIRFDEDQREASLFFDGVRIARGVPVSFATKGTLRTGVSFMAPKRERCGVKIELFEVFKTRIDDTRERTY